MASIAGSQFIATAPGQPVNLVETADGSGLPPTVAGSFNLEVWTGTAPYPAAPAAGYQGLAILGPGGTSITLVTGAFAVEDTATGGAVDTITALGDNETIAAGPGNNDFLSAYGSGDVVIGGGHDTINLYGAAETVNAVGDDLILAFGGAVNARINGGAGNDTIQLYAGSTGGTIDAGTGNDLINIVGTNDTVIGQGGNDTINVLASGDSVFGGGGNDFILAVGDNDTIAAGAGNTAVAVLGNGNEVFGGTAGSDTISIFGNANTVFGGTAPMPSIGVYGDNNVIGFGTGNDAATVSGSGNQVSAGVTAGANQDTVTFLSGSNNLFADGGNQFADTVIGFNQAAGDRIHLAPADTVATSTLQPNGQDTLITLSDNSTILLKGVTHIDNTFFS